MKKMKRLFCILLCLSAGAAFVANGEESFPRHRGERNFGQFRNNGGNMRGGAFFGRIAAEEKIAVAFPEKYAALEAAREKYEQELAALAKAAGVELPAQSDDALRQMRKKFPAEFAAALKEMETSPREAMGKLRQIAEKAGVKLFNRGNRGSRSGFAMKNESPNQFARRIDRPDMGKLRRKYPEQMREYDELRQKDPDAARRKLMEIIAKERGGEK